MKKNTFKGLPEAKLGTISLAPSLPNSSSIGILSLDKLDKTSREIWLHYAYLNHVSKVRLSSQPKYFLCSISFFFKFFNCKISDRTLRRKTRLLKNLGFIKLITRIIRLGKKYIKFRYIQINELSSGVTANVVSSFNTFNSNTVNFISNGLKKLRELMGRELPSPFSKVASSFKRFATNSLKIARKMLAPTRDLVPLAPSGSLDPLSSKTIKGGTQMQKTQALTKKQKEIIYLKQKELIDHKHGLQKVLDAVKRGNALWGDVGK